MSTQLPIFEIDCFRDYRTNWLTPRDGRRHLYRYLTSVNRFWANDTETNRIELELPPLALMLEPILLNNICHYV